MNSPTTEERLQKERQKLNPPKDESDPTGFQITLCIICTVLLLIGASTVLGWAFGEREDNDFNPFNSSRSSVPSPVEYREEQECLSARIDKIPCEEWVRRAPKTRACWSRDNQLISESICIKKAPRKCFITINGQDHEIGCAPTKNL